jgi:hypothetical protein
MTPLSAPVIEAEAALMTEPPARRATPNPNPEVVPVPPMLPSLTTVPALPLI